MNDKKFDCRECCRAAVGAGGFGDAVLITDKAGTPIARGLTNYNHEDVALIKGHKSSEFARLLKVETYWDEVIHRDDLVVEGH